MFWIVCDDNMFGFVIVVVGRVGVFLNDRIDDMSSSVVPMQVVSLHSCCFVCVQCIAYVFIILFFYVCSSMFNLCYEFMLRLHVFQHVLGLHEFDTVCTISHELQTFSFEHETYCIFFVEFLRRG